MSKLASYSFDLKHLPEKLNVVADSLSRDPFAKSIGQRLLKEPYSSLLRDAAEIEESSVHDVFMFTCQTQSFGSSDH